MQAGLSISALEPGSFVDRFRIVRRLAIGGMAELYLADATGIEGFEKRLVLKRILPQYLDRPEFVGMFLDEARLAATLHHPNIGQVYDIGCDGDTYYFTMEYIEGRDVRHIRKRTLALDQDIPVAHTVAIALGIAGGLHAAHEQRGPDGSHLGIVHRDVSPANVLVSWDGHVKLIDFGIAKASRRQTHTRTGILKGKSCNMSPEQCLASPVDRRSDVFSLGIMLYELSTSTRLFHTESEFETMRMIVRGEYESPRERRPDYPEGLEHIVMRALARDPDDRYQTAQEMFVDLDCFAREERLAVSPYHIADYLRELFPRDESEGEAAGSSPPLFLLGDEVDVSEVSDVSQDGDELEGSGCDESVEIDLSESVELPLERANTINFPRVEPERRSPAGRAERAAAAKAAELGAADTLDAVGARDIDAATADSDPQLEETRRAETVTLARRPDSEPVRVGIESRKGAGRARSEPREPASPSLSRQSRGASPSRATRPRNAPSEPPTSLINVREGRAQSAPLFASNLSIVALCGSLAVAVAVLLFGIFADDGWFARSRVEHRSAQPARPAAAPQAAAPARARAPSVARLPSAPLPARATPDEPAVVVVPMTPDLALGAARRRAEELAKRADVVPEVAAEVVAEVEKPVSDEKRVADRSRRKARRRPSRARTKRKRSSSSESLRARAERISAVPEPAVVANADAGTADSNQAKSSARPSPDDRDVKPSANIAGAAEPTSGTPSKKRLKKPGNRSATKRPPSLLDN